MRLFTNILLMLSVTFSFTGFAISQQSANNVGGATSGQPSQETVITVTNADGTIERYKGEQAVKIFDEFQPSATICEGAWTGSNEIDFTVVNQSKIDPFKIIFRNLGFCSKVELSMSPVIISGKSFNINLTVPTIQTGSVSGTFSNDGNSVSGSFTYSNNSCGSATTSGSWSGSPVTACASAPTANFSGSPRSGSKPLTVQFNDQSSGNITSRSWNFGDGGSSTSTNPSHTYNNAGTYTVALTVTGPGGSNTRTRNNYITVNESAPTANFTGSPTSGNKPLIVQFSDQSSGNINSRLWNFGDGSSSTSTNPSHTYNNAGTYTVALTVAGPGGSNTKTRNNYISVTEPQNNAPVLSNIGDQTVEAGTTTNVALSASDADGDQLIFNIPTNPGFLSITNVSQTGNNSSATLVISPSINQTGTFNAEVRVSDSQAGSDSETFVVTSNPSISNPPPSAPQNLQATAGDRQVSLNWDANTEPDFLQYNIYGGTSPNPTARVAFNMGISNTFITITGLNNGAEHYFRISAEDSARQESGFSNEVSATPGTASQFTRIIEGDIVNDGGNSTGTAWGDYDNDGDLDLFVANSGNQNNFLYANNGDGTFTKVTTGPPVSDGGDSYGAAWGDYDNDGDLDLFVANPSNLKNFLYDNNGDGTFTKVTTGPPVSDGGGSYGAAWGDYDNDGDLDLFVANGGEGFFENNFLYQNNGDGTFTKLTTGPPVSDGGNSTGASWGDYDNDGDLDLFVTNFINQDNFLYANNGDGTFTKVNTGPLVSDGGDSWGASWGDYDNDGDLDLFVGNDGNQNSFLYANNGDGTFTKVTSGPPVSNLGNSMGQAWGDYDNDGDLDLFVANYSDPNSFLYTNNADGTFTRVTSGLPVSNGGNSWGASWGDYDNDGDLDLFIAKSGNQNNYLYANNGISNHWINLQLVGTQSNTSAIGGQVRLKATIFGAAVWQLNEISGQTGFNGQNSLNAEFGLGDATVIDSIKIEWPSGIEQVLTNVVADQFLTITEEGEIPPMANFTRITTGDIANDVDNSSGASWGDYDEDGDLDLHVANGGPDRLYKNNGNGTFTSVTGGVFAGDGSNSRTSSWGDYDNDGDLDLFVANCCGELNFLFANNGDGSFTRITAGIIVNDEDARDSFGGSWVDYDNDGDLDLFVADNPNLLYENKGDGTFAKITTGAIVNEGTGPHGAWGDFDNDGDLDLFATGSPNNLLYRNNGDGSFTKETTGAVVNNSVGNAGGSWGDYDNDGDLDLFVTAGFGSNRLYTNNGDGTFIEVTTGDIADDVSNSWGSSWGDYDNDGDLDLFVARNHLNEPSQINFGQDNLLYVNDGAGNFIKITTGTIVNDGGYSAGCIWGDYDNDGDLDLFVTNDEEGDSQDENDFLYRNNGNSNHWINVQCIGTLSNTTAIGTKVRIKATIKGKPVWQLREISGQTGYSSQNSLNAEFGLGDATVIETIKIEWPSGIEQVLENVPVNQFLVIEEDVETSVEEPLSAVPQRYSLSQNYPNPFNPQTTIQYELPKTGQVKLVVYNLTGHLVATLVNNVQSAGIHTVQWNGKDFRGREVASGIYLFRLETEKFVQTKKLALIR